MLPFTARNGGTVERKSSSLVPRWTAVLLMYSIKQRAGQISSSSMSGSEKDASAPVRCLLRTFNKLNDTAVLNWLIDVALMDPNSLTLNRVASDRSVAVLHARARKSRSDDGPWLLAKRKTTAGSQVWDNLGWGGLWVSSPPGVTVI